ncbi:MAG: hypothetical protein JSS32_10410 [Verrucomicrobia bacterium]|nr:hypothetical protein [Verrucomicrobiota bacterium]
MKTLLIRLFVENWQRKLISLILAMIIWMVVQHSMTSTKQVHNVPVKVTNLPPKKTIEGMQINGILNKRLTLNVTGNKAAIDDLTGRDLEVNIDATDKPDHWLATITKKNLVSLNPELDISKMINRVTPVEMLIKQSKLVTERIPVTVTAPIGEPPKGYQYLDVWPDQLYVTVTGPEESVKVLKSRGGQKLIFNLNDVSRAELDALQSSKKNQVSDEVSFFVPNAWKKINLPLLSETPVEIDDPQAKSLRLDFSREELLPIESVLPVTIFFPPKYTSTLNPETYTLSTNDFIVKKNGIKVIATPLYAQGVTRQFLEIVKDMIQVVIIASPRTEREKLLWSAQFMYPRELEDRYVAKVISDSSDEVNDVQPHLREDYLRNRFRSYMSRFRLYTPDHKKLNLKIELKANTISVAPQNL